MTGFDLERIQASFFSRYWAFELRPEDGCCTCCQGELARRLPHITKESWQARFALGGVYLAGRPATADTPVAPPCRLEYYEPTFDPTKGESFYPQFSGEMILLEDEDLGIAFKPAGLPTTPARDQQRFHMQGYLEAWYGQAVHMPSRLDTAVSGLLLFSRSSRGNRWCQKAQERRLVEKLYLCEVSGQPKEKTMDLRRPIARDERHPVLRKAVHSGGEDAWTRVSFLCNSPESPSRSILQARPLTGRTHQIRVHCAAEGWPIVGDPFYGGAEAPALRLASYAISFLHPFHQRRIQLELPQVFRPDWVKAIDKSILDAQLHHRS